MYYISKLQQVISETEGVVSTKVHVFDTADISDPKTSVEIIKEDKGILAPQSTDFDYIFNTPIEDFDALLIINKGDRAVTSQILFNQWLAKINAPKVINAETNI